MELPLELFQDLLRSPNITGCPQADPDDVLTSWNGSKKGIERDDTVDLRRREMKAFRNAMLNFFRQVPANVLGFLQYRDEGSMLSLIFCDDLIDLFPFFSGNRFNQSHLIPSLSHYFRLLKNAHLPCSPHPSSLQRTFKYASLLKISGALHLGIFDQPEKMVIRTSGYQAEISRFEMIILGLLPTVP
jgi:hypothetical protein